MNTNVYALLLAGGMGNRMGNAEVPKQFIQIGKRPLFVHTVARFLKIKDFREILLLVPGGWEEKTKEILDVYFPSVRHLRVLQGGETRNDTIMQGMAYLQQEGHLNEESILVTHDVARPFVRASIIQAHIRLAASAAAVDTLIPAVDTIASSRDGRTVEDIPDRTSLYYSQTPQTFRGTGLRRYYMALSQQERASLTDACKIMLLKGEKVVIVEGDTKNIKVTYPLDIQLAEVILKMESEDETT